MNDIRRVLRLAGTRLLINRIIRHFFLAATILAAAFVLALIAARVFALQVPWLDALLYATIGAALLSIAWAGLTRRKPLGVARELDERADLRESLSTALCFADQDDPWCKVVVATAQDRARKVNVRQAVPIEAPRTWPLPMGIALAFAIVWFTLPDLNLWNKKPDPSLPDPAALIEQAKLDARVAEEKVREQLQKIALDVQLDPSPEAADRNPDAQDPDAIRREAIRRLTTLNERLEQLKHDESSTQLDAMKQALRQLRPPPGQSALNDMARAMAAGKFDEARDALEQLQQQLSEGSLSPEQKEQVQKQLQNLAEQLKKAAENTRELEQQLQQAGLNPEQARKAAADPQAMKEALENLQNLTPEQREALQKQLQQKQNAQSQCQSMGDMMSQMSQGMGPGNMSQEALEAMEGLGGSLSELEMMAQEMSALDAAQSECRAQLARLGECMGQCEGDSLSGDPNRVSPWAAGDKRGLGMGSGGPGRGQGDNTPGQETPFDREASRSNVHRGQGPIIGTRLVFGDQVRGESLAEFQQAASASAEAAAQAIANQQVPRELEGSVKHYFGRIVARGNAKDAEKSEPPK